ncbi:hypothetical protein [Streptomyces sp. AJS327]|nr:hypothetical protein [Streptomyces sp. AJS327]
MCEGGQRFGGDAEGVAGPCEVGGFGSLHHVDEVVEFVSLEVGTADGL